MRPLLLVLLLFPGFCHAEVYRSVAPDGTVSYSDQAAPGARAIDLPPPSSYLPRVVVPTPVPSAASGIESTPEAAEYSTGGAQRSYERFALVAPVEQETIWSNEGVIEVAFDVRPSLDEDHSVRVLVDGAQAAMLAGPYGRVEGIERGTHTLRAELVNGDDKVLAATDTVTVHLQKQSVNLPRRR